MRWLSTASRLLIEPAPSLQSAEARVRARWLSGLLLAFWTATLVALLIERGSDEFIGLLALWIALGVAYASSRTAHYLLAVCLTLVMLFGQAIYLASHASPAASRANLLFVHGWLLIPVAASTVWLRWRGVCAVACASVAILLVHGVVAPIEVGLLFPSVLLISVASSLLVLGASMRGRDLAHLEEQQRSLVGAQSQARTAIRAKDEFLANMSHELRTPMNAIQGMVSLMLSSELTDEELESLSVIRESGDSLMALLNDILDYSKLEAERLELVVSAFSLHACVEDAVDAIESRSVAKGLGLDIEWSDDAPDFVCTDRARLRQVLDNLLDNALKFTDQGRIRVEVASRPVTSDESIDAAVRASFASCEHADLERMHRLSIRVRDTGIGVPDAMRQAIFRVFHQADSSMTRRHGGTGLGLAISKRLMELMHGRLWLEGSQEDGPGSTFCISLPVVGVDPEYAAELAYEQRRRRRRRTDISALLEEGPQEELSILLVEDNPFNQKVAVSMLRRLGYEPDVVDNGRKAVTAIHDHSYDVVLMDVQMPVMDGLEATRRVRSDVDEAHQPYIIAVTAHTLQGDRETCLGAGMNDYLGKPFQLNDLERVLRHADASRLSQP